MRLMVSRPDLKLLLGEGMSGYSVTLRALTRLSNCGFCAFNTEAG